jgi:hypothetical protein
MNLVVEEKIEECVVARGLVHIGNVCYSRILKQDKHVSSS